MTDIAITESITEVTVSDTTIEVDVTEQVVEVTVAISVPEGAARTRYVGSEFSGVSGDTGRFKVHTEGISTQALVSMGYRVLDPNSEYTLSTVTNTNDKLTINKPMEDDDVVIIWNF